jgi:hypothetical protein
VPDEKRICAHTGGGRVDTPGAPVRECNLKRNGGSAVMEVFGLMFIIALMAAFASAIAIGIVEWVLNWLYEKQKRRK